MGKGHGGRRLLELCGPEVDGFSKCLGSGTGKLGSESRIQGRPRGAQEGERTAAKKGPSAGVHAATASGDRLPRKCKFAELTGCSGSQPSWLCKVFGKKTPEDRSRIIADNMLHMSVLFTAQI